MNLESLEVLKDDEVEEKPIVLRLYSKDIGRQCSHQTSDEKKKMLKQINKEKVWKLTIFSLSICPSLHLFIYYVLLLIM